MDKSDYSHAKFLCYTFLHYRPLWKVMWHCLFSFAEGLSVTITANTQIHKIHNTLLLMGKITSLSLPYSRFCVNTASLASQLHLFTHTHNAPQNKQKQEIERYGLLFTGGLPLPWWLSCSAAFKSEWCSCEFKCCDRKIHHYIPDSLRHRTKQVPQLHLPLVFKNSNISILQFIKDHYVLQTNTL